jgi:hypothetical protein
MDMDKDTDTILYRLEQKKPESRFVSDFVAIFFAKLKKFCLFRCFETVSKRTETKNRRFETNRN